MANNVWISVKERLPEWGTIVIGYNINSGHVGSAEKLYTSNDLYFDDGCGCATHWTKLRIPPLPESPEK
jgi:hypothetical protein